MRTQHGKRRQRKKGGLGVVAAAVACLALSTASLALASPRLAQPGSTHPSFPLDAFAKPAYSLVFANDEPVGNATAKELLRRARRGSKGEADDIHNRHDVARLHTEEQQRHQDESSEGGQWPKAPFRAYLHRSSPDSLHICTLAEPQEASKASHKLYLDDAGITEYRRRVLSRALELLAPLRESCLYHTLNWFTYSLCYGDAIKQFRALSGNSMTGKAPTPDPSKPSFVLGRWRNGIDSIRGEASRSPASPDSHATVTDGSSSEEAAARHSGNGLMASHRGSAATSEDIPRGTELMELVHFSSLDDTQLGQRDGQPIASYASLEGKGRYISQTWSDGTLCDMNDEPRTAEVQYHCAETSVRDRISYVKEVTTCNYVVVVETSRLCQEPALKQKEDEVHEVRCRPILSDEALEAHIQRNISRQKSSLAIDAANASARDGGQKGDSKADKNIEDDNARTDPQDGRSKGASDRQAGQAALQNIMDELRAKMRDRHVQDFNEVEIVVGWDENGQFILEPRQDGAALDPYEIFGPAGVASAVEQAEAHARAADGDAQGATVAPQSAVQDIHAEQTAAALRQVQDLVDRLAAMQNDGGATLGMDEIFHDALEGATRTQEQPNAPTAPQAAQQPQHAGQGNVQGRSGQPVPPPGGQAPAQQVPHPRGRALAREPETLGTRVERFYKLLEAQQAQKQQQQQRQQTSGENKEEKRKQAADGGGDGAPLRRKDEL